MPKKKRSEVCVISPSKTVVKWKSHYDGTNGTFFLNAINYTVIIPSALIAGIMVGADPGLFLAGGAYAAVSTYFTAHIGHRFATNTVLGSKARVNILDSWKASKNKRKLLESYYVNHERPFAGLVTKEQESSEEKATHLVKTYLVNGFLRQHIEQEIEELPEIMWDKTLDFIEETMTKPVQELENLPAAGDIRNTNKRKMAVPMYDLIFNSNSNHSK